MYTLQDHRFIYIVTYVLNIHARDTSRDEHYVVTPLILCKISYVRAFNTLNVRFTYMVHALGRNM